MALRNDKGNYLKITSVDIIGSIVSVKGDVYESEAVRRGGLTDFQAAKMVNECYDRNDSYATTGKALRDELITMGYGMLKAGEYADWIDC